MEPSATTDDMSECATYEDDPGQRANSLLGQVTQEQTSTSTTRYVRDPAGTLIGMRDNTGTNYYYALDNVGSVLMLVNGSQTASATYTYDPYGNTLTNTGTGGVNTINLRSPAFPGQGFPVNSRCRSLVVPFGLDLVRGSVPERGMEPNLIVA